MREPEIETAKKRRLVSTEIAAKAIGLSPGTLQNHRTQRKGLPYVKLGKKVFYDTVDILQYIEDNKIRHD